MEQGEPKTVPATRRRAINLRAEELLNAIIHLLREKSIECGSYELDPGENCTTVMFYRVKENDTEWENDRYIFFDINGKAFQTLTSRLGSGPFPLLIQKSRTIEESKTENGCEVILDVVAMPNPDRSVTFYPVKKREGNFVHF